MSDKRRGSERSREISAIKKQGRNRRGRGVPLPGLWACRTAAGLTQRELAMLVGTSQGTITSLEHMSRGAKASPSTYLAAKRHAKITKGASPRRTWTLPAVEGIGVSHDG
jgi:DNA-binding XRE family transcriptional regulator